MRCFFARFRFLATELMSMIYTVRGEQAMLDSDLAKLYGLETRALNQAVTRNPDRFPELFCFRLTKNEMVIRGHVRHDMDAPKDRTHWTRRRSSTGLSCPTIELDAENATGGFEESNLPKFPTMPRKAVITLAVKKTKLNEHGFPIDDGRPYSRSNRRKRVRRHYPGLRFHELQRTSISLMIANCVDFRTASERASYSKVSATIHDGHPQRCLLRKRQNIRERGWKVSKLTNKVPNGVESRTVPQRCFPPQEL